MTAQAIHRVFYGWRVVGAAFILAVFGWGIGFYGPPLYLHALQESRHWPLALISAAVSAHFVIGAIVVANLPALYRRFGLPAVTKAGAISLALGIGGWAAAGTPWELFAATALSGFGWSALGPAAVNAIIAPWFVRTRPAALGAAYNGASVGGVIYSPLLAFAISLLGFSAAAALSGLIIVVTIWILADTIFSRTPQQMGLSADGGGQGGSMDSITSPKARPLPGTRLWRSRAFATLAAAMALGLFAQVGLIAHLFSLLVPALGTQLAGWAMGLAAACAVGGRTLVGWLMPVDADRRIVACASYAVQIVGSLALLFAAGGNVPLLLLGVVLFGLGIGNATSLPPLIAQVEFVKEDVQRAVALTVAISQAVYAFAPLVFGLIRSFEPAQAAGAGQAPTIFIASAVIQALTIACLLIGRRGKS